MILTVTLNTALDITYRVRSLRPHASHRVSEVTERPGGKGVNVARVLAALGHEVTVTGFAGGHTGAVLRSMLAETPVAPVARDRGGADAPGALADALVPVSGATRRTVAVVDERTGDTTQLNEPGPQISPAEWAAFLGRYQELLPGASAVALCGSLPPGVPVGAYAGLVRAARSAGVPVLLDTSGEPLRRGVAARPDVIKPNTEELAELTGSYEPLRATQDARRRGAHAVVASSARTACSPSPRRATGAPPRPPPSAATPRAPATRRWRACSPAWWSTCPGRTAWPARPPCRRRRYGPRRRASSTPPRTRNSSAGSGSRGRPARPRRP